MSKLKFAIIGCGHIAQRHAEHINDQASLVAVCDIVEQKAEDLAKKYSCNAFTDLEELLKVQKDVDVVSICTPNALHAGQSILALSKEKHVVCEKPMATNLSDGKNIVDAVSKTDRKFFVIKQNRFNPPIRALKEAVDEGKLGKIVNVQVNCFWNRNNQYYQNSDWKGKKDIDGGTLYTQFSHFVDLMYWFVGDVKEVHAFGKNFFHQDLVEFEDTGVVALEFESGALGTINYTVNSYEKNMEGSITLFGEKGSVKVGGQYLNALEYQKIEGYEIKGVDESRPANDYGYYQGSMSNHDKVYKNVIDVLSGNGVVATTAYEGMKTVEIIEKIYDKINMNGNFKK